MPNRTPPDVRPIQVFLDTKQFIDTEEPHKFNGGSKDFFKGNNRGFVQHRERITTRATTVAQALRSTRQPAGFIKVRQREEALAKSHRPLGHLFTVANRFALVGTERVGELLFQTTPADLEHLAGTISTKAEATPRRVLNEHTGQYEERVSGYRSEVGGISEIELYSATDRLDFSADEAMLWMQQPTAIGGYIVELFRPDRTVDKRSVEQLISQFRAGIDAIKGGLLVRPILPSTPTAQFGDPILALSVQLVQGENRRLIDLPFLANGQAVEVSEAPLPSEMRGALPDATPQRHSELLAFLAEQALVRKIELAPIIETAPRSHGAVAGQPQFPGPNANADYPVVGIVDGGVSATALLSKWKVGDAGLVPIADRDEVHATFIAGLVSAGGALNPALANTLEPVGCKFFDLDLFPRRDLRRAYYPDIEDLFDNLDEKVKAAKRDHGVRVFNLSFAIGKRGSRLAYSLAADRLDRIARSNDVVFVVAAGNLMPPALRPPWPQAPQDAIMMLAGFGTAEQQITAPSDHILGLTVGAINPPLVAGHVELMPTTYTRRGPGVGGARKPDLAHYGGADDGPKTGLMSLTPLDKTVHNCGTSFASPLVAATLATLDQRLARRASRETLMALPIHRARRADTLDMLPLRHVAREFVGFGIPPTADMVLNDDPHSVTLVFNERLFVKQRLEFLFTWPRSLSTAEGACRGRADVTLGYTPPIDPSHREEAIRVLLEASLHQEDMDVETGEVWWASRLTHDGSHVAQGTSASESYLIKAGLKWSPLKRYYVSMPKGRGKSSSWRLSLHSLVRAGVTFPADGIPFTVILTLSDLGGSATIREEMRLDLQRRGLTLADITIAHEVRARSK